MWPDQGSLQNPKTIYRNCPTFRNEKVRRNAKANVVEQTGVGFTLPFQRERHDLAGGITIGPVRVFRLCIETGQSRLGVPSETNAGHNRQTSVSQLQWALDGVLNKSNDIGERIAKLCGVDILQHAHANVC